MQKSEIKSDKPIFFQIFFLIQRKALSLRSENEDHYTIYYQNSNRIIN